MKLGKAILTVVVFVLLWQLLIAQNQQEPTQPEFAPQIFWVHSVFSDSKDVAAIDEKIVEAYQERIVSAKEAGLIPFGNTMSWVFPDFVGAPEVPAFHNPDPTTVLVSPDCVPELLSPEYSRLTEIRNEMYATLAHEFSDLNVWIVGLEPELDFRNCSGEQLPPKEMVHFAIDTLQGACSAIKSETPNAKVIGHFLGRSHIPIRVREQVIQPSVFLELMKAEMSRRGTPETQCLDMWADAVAPELLADRFPEEPAGVDFDSKGTRSAGWNEKWIEEFTTKEDDLILEYDHWESISYDDEIVEETTIAVNDDQDAEGRLKTSTAEEGSFAAARTNPDYVPPGKGVDVVPDGEFDSEGDERNKWTGVMDFFPKVETDDATVHAGGFIRVNEMTDEQTRIGATVYSGNLTETGCSNEPCGCLQLSGESDSSPGVVETLYFYFALKVGQQGEQPWDYPTHLYRAQIFERERYDRIMRWVLEWKAEVWDLTDDQLLGSRGYVSAYTLRGQGILIPGLTDSMFALGLCCGEEGGIDVERTSTAYWEY